jgi:hypothetical protein
MRPQTVLAEPCLPAISRPCATRAPSASARQAPPRATRGSSGRSPEMVASAICWWAHQGGVAAASTQPFSQPWPAVVAMAATCRSSNTGCWKGRRAGARPPPASARICSSPSRCERATETGQPGDSSAARAVGAARVKQGRTEQGSSPASSGGSAARAAPDIRGAASRAACYSSAHSHHRASLRRRHLHM